MNNSYAQILEKILSLVSQYVRGKIELSEDTVLQDDVGLSSLQIMELIFEVEEEFDISFPHNRLPDIRTVKELSETIVAAIER